MLENDRAKLLGALGLHAKKPPPSWRGDGADPTLRLKKKLGLKYSAQKAHFDTISSPQRPKPKVIPTGAAPTFLETVTAHQEEYPGPGKYYKDDLNSKMSGGKFNLSKPLSDLQLQEKEAKSKPGPGDYEQLLLRTGVPLKSKGVVRFGTSPMVTELDILMREARRKPGPGEHGPWGGVDKPKAHSSCKFNKSVVPTALEMVIRHANDTPAPHDYGEVAKLRTSGGQFSTAFPPSSLEKVILEKRGIPGPASYVTPVEPGNYAGRINMAKTPGEFDRALLRASRVPGPGEYSVTKTNTGVGTLTVNPGPAKWPRVLRPEPTPAQVKAGAKRQADFKARQAGKATHGTKAASSHDEYGDDGEFEDSYGSDESNTAGATAAAAKPGAKSTTKPAAKSGAVAAGSSKGATAKGVVPAKGKAAAGTKETQAKPGTKKPAPAAHPSPNTGTSGKAEAEDHEGSYGDGDFS